MAARTTLPLFWHLASVERQARLDSSFKLISTLHQFQERFFLETPVKDNSEPDSEVEEGAGIAEDKEYEISSHKLDNDNAADVSYAVRRLIRGLASPRESSRLGFAVALTEVRLFVSLYRLF